MTIKYQSMSEKGGGYDTLTHRLTLDERGKVSRIC